MKVLLVCADNAESSFASQCRDAFAKLGCDIQTFNYRMLQLHRFAPTAKLVNALLLRKARQFKPQLMLVIKGEALLPGTVQQICALGVKTANWILDEPFGKFGKYNRVTNMAEYDHLFLFDAFYAKELAKQGMPASYLSVGADPKLHREIVPVAERTYTCDLRFMGSHLPNREQLFTKLADFDFRISGYRWNTVPKRSPLFPHIERDVLKANKRTADVAAMCRLFNLSRINLNLHHAQAVEGGASLRLFECSATNSFLISDYNPGLEKLYKPDKEIVYYRDAAELRRKIDYYLAHDTQRLRIARAAQRRTLKEHKVVDRIRTLLKAVKV